MPIPRLMLTLGVLLLAVTPPAIAQEAVAPPDSVHAQIRAVLRAFYLNFANQNWDALAAYVLSPKLLERRGAPGELQMVARDRTRRRGSPPAVAAPRTCPSSTSPMIDEAAIRLDGDWADVSCPVVTGLHRGWMSLACCTSSNGGDSSTLISSRVPRRLNRLSGEGWLVAHRQNVSTSNHLCGENVRQDVDRP